jgi:hypothetical protein
MISMTSSSWTEAWLLRLLPGGHGLHYARFPMLAEKGMLAAATRIYGNGADGPDFEPRQTALPPPLGVPKRHAGE